MADGTKKQVVSLRKGDVVATYTLQGQLSTATVECLVKFEIASNTKRLCTFESGLVITPGHPILIGGDWTYPREVQAPEPQACSSVFNLVLSNDHIAIINDTPVISLGHNYQQGILKHEYLGTKKVIRDLQTLSGYQQGFVTITGKLEMGFLDQRQKVNRRAQKTAYDTENMDISVLNC